eukprot:TRINITY_DN16545_c0_g1_i1.p1 TRINITY_DN16545_c0_g1~~TRINITY_DN16545_c0_g1_i1.p1  ORF type:complete len:501 (+),score=78.92 TRINITY_DN16545_c0_g1_i1:46-1548(+)
MSEQPGDVSESARKALDEKEAAMKAIQESQASRSKEVEASLPVLDPDVRVRLREMGEPVTLFGEGPYERRLRLRQVLAGELLSGKTLQKITVSKTAAKKQTERFMTKGSEALREARLEITSYSLKAARERIAKQQQQHTDTTIDSIESKRSKQQSLLSGYTTFASQVGGDRPLSGIKVSPDAKRALISSWDSKIRLFDIPECDKTQDYKNTFHGHKDRVTGVCWHPNAFVSQSNSSLNFASCSADKSVKLWGVDSENPIETLGGHSDRINKIAMHPSGSFVATTSQDRTWRLWDVTAGRQSYGVLDQEGHASPVYGIDIQSDGSLVATGDTSGIGRIWDLRHGYSIFVLQGHQKQVLAVSFSPNGWLMCTGGDDNIIKLWDLRRREVLKTISAHGGLISSAKFDPSGDFLVTTSYDTTLKIWDTSDFSHIRTLRGHDDKVMSCDISNDGSIVSCAFDRTWKYWNKQTSVGDDEIDELLLDKARAETESDLDNIPNSDSEG